MPHRVWKHYCTVTKITVWTPRQEICGECSKKGKYDGWGYSMIEAMAMYQRLTGLKAIGPHREYADKHFANTIRLCNNCNGTGLHDVGSGKSYRFCHTCNGTGKVFCSNDKEIERIRRRVLKRFPDAGVNS